MKDKRVAEIIKYMLKCFEKRENLEYEEENLNTNEVEISFEKENNKRLYVFLKKNSNYVSEEVQEENKDRFILKLDLSNYSSPEKFFDARKEPAYDDTEEAWQLYKRIYSEEEIELTNDKQLLICGEEMSVSGDIIFNINDKKCTNYFEQIIDADNNFNEKAKEEIKESLKVCQDNNYNPCNIGVILKTGGLNTCKQVIGNDRQDVFLASIRNYYVSNKREILENYSTAKMTYNNKMCLKKELDSLGEGEEGFKNFLKVFYHLDYEKDSEYINALLNNADETIDCCEKVLKYLYLAMGYWIIIYAKYRELVKEIYTEYDSMDEISAEFEKAPEKIRNLIKEYLELIRSQRGV